MLAVVIKRTIPRLDLRNLYVSVAHNNCIFGMNRYQSKKLILPSITSKGNIIICRNFSHNEKEGEEKKIFLQLIPGPFIVKYPFFNFFKICWYKFCIPYLMKDHEFNLNDILESARKAVSMVSIALSNKDYDSLNDLVDSDVLEILKLRIDSLTEEQRKLIAITEESIFLYFPYSLKWISSKDTKTVELEVVIYYVPGINVNKLYSPDNIDKFIKFDKYVSNYTFKKDYIQGSDTYWIIKYLNHLHTMKIM